MLVCSGEGGHLFVAGGGGVGGRERGWSGEQIVKRIGAQMAVAEKMRRSDHVVWTDGPVEAHEAQWDALLSSWGFEA